MNLQNRDSTTEKVNGDAKFGISITEKDMQSEPQASNNDGSCQDYQAVQELLWG
jgi:hypothetical protein